MKQLLKLALVFPVLVGSLSYSGGSQRPEYLGANWARVSDKVQIELIVDELRAVAEGRLSGRIVRNHVAPDLDLSSIFKVSSTLPAATRSAHIYAGASEVLVNGKTASIETGAGERLLFEKINNTWRVTGGSMRVQQALVSPENVTSLTMGDGTSKGKTFVQTPMSREHGIGRLSRSVTRARIDRALFSTPEKTASYYYAHYMESAPYVSATYIQFVTDPDWNRIVYGNMNHWIKSYDNVLGPSAIVTDAEGRVFVGETGNKRVTVLRIVGDGSDAQLQPLYYIPNITNPSDIALNDNGTPLDVSDDLLYVADASQNKILKYLLGPSAATLVKTFDGFDTPTCVLVGKWNGASSGLLYVVDQVAKRIRLFNDTGSELSLIKEVRGDYSQYFKSIKADHFGNIYVVDNVNSQVFKFTAAFELLDSEGGDDVFAALGNVDIPFGKIVIDGQGTYWAGFDQMFAVERWAEASGAQRRTLGLSLKNIEFRSDRDVSTVDNQFILTDFGDVKVRVYDSRNSLVRTLNSAWMISGWKNITWDRRNDAGVQVPADTYRYEIAATSAYREEPTVSLTQFYLPMYYWENSGSSKQSDDAHLVQGSALAWGTEPSQLANEHATSVQYRFKGLNPESEYEVSAEYVANDGVRRMQDMTVSGQQLHEAMMVSNTPTQTGFIALPKETFATGEVVISINARAEGSAIVSQLWFKETGVGFSLQQVNESVPTSYALEQNYPNPFNPSTVIRYSIPIDGPVALKVYDITGREVVTLVDEHKSAGTYKARFDIGIATGGRNLASGVYFYRLTAGDFSETKKLLLLK
ncbi:MAG: T9SS type A sorting domain-containing protein [Ignavibacteria bacterium]|nr:T9SS type A sorting domain-containing protein [Ignavibacteria bacterium]